MKRVNEETAKAGADWAAQAHLENKPELLELLAR
jgi:hypothetical protein